MENALFSQEELDILLRPDRWRFVGSGFSPGVAAVRNARHEQWMVSHCHAHAHREMLFILSGEGFQGFMGMVFPSRPGTAFLFDAMQPHDIGYPPGQGQAVHLYTGFVHDRCMVRTLIVQRGGAFRERWKTLFSLPELGLASADALFVPASEKGMPPDMVRMRCASAAALALSGVVGKGFQPRQRPESLQEEVIAAISKHIRASAGRGCRLESLARIAGYSKYHFLRLFQQHTGMTLRQYVNLCREEACLRMAQEGATQKAMSAALGFAHPSAFARWKRRGGLGGKKG